MLLCLPLQRLAMSSHMSDLVEMGWAQQDPPVRTMQRCHSAAAVHFYGCTALKRL